MLPVSISSSGPYELLTYSEASDYLSLSVRQLERAVQRGALEHYRPNGHNVRFTTAQLDAFLEHSRVPRLVTS